ncbi:putative disease resistance protein RGA3 [Papaver somniferum]|uniref:putative disease resistance protein RGA3 n=1 Tax=Papaver somniferum TaxID=3469 RepID=UPI000E702C8F|nr:putative disease resistance protein RGA3 [Papaver somniferum]
MAGLGKTKLARTVYNDESLIKHFQLRIWVTVPAVFDLGEVLKKMISYVKTNDVKRDYGCYVLKTNDLTMILREMLNGKKYLLVLDDFWDVENFYIWENLISRLTFGSHGSKILITSRKINVARSVRWMTDTYHLQELSTDECWSIIKEKAFSSPRSRASENPEMVKIAKDLARKCCGLPLAARILAYILASKTKESEWDFFQECFKTRKHSKFHTQIYPTLQLSYDHLPSSALKQCFSHCSVFPMGYEIDREEIIKLWMAEGFLVPSKHKGDELGEIQKCKLNDLVYHLAATVAGDEDEHVPRMFQEVGNYKNRLRTFFATEVGDCDKIENVFRNRNLRVLYLSGSSIQKLPASLSKLRHLRYLNLSGCQNLDVLDDQFVNSLYNLQTLVLHKCTSLSKLPEGLPVNIGALKDLRSLNISHTGITILPTSVTSLQNLRALDVSNCINFEGLPGNIGSLKDLRSLDISHTKVSRLSDSISDLERLMTLRLHSCPNLEDLPKGIEALGWLKGLDITGTKVKVVPDQFLA